MKINISYFVIIFVAMVSCKQENKTLPIRDHRLQPEITKNNQTVSKFMTKFEIKYAVCT